MNWIEQIPNDDLLDVAAGVLEGCAAAVQEFRAAKLAWKPQNKAAQLRLNEARKYLRERFDTYEAVAHELKKRGLK